MPKTDFNRKITLQKRTQDYGRGGDETVTASAIVWGCVEEVSMTFQVSSQQIGLTPSLMVHVWRSEFAADAYTHCVVDGVAYRIGMVGTSYNDGYVKLALERG